MPQPNLRTLPSQITKSAAVNVQITNTQNDNIIGSETLEDGTRREVKEIPRLCERGGMVYWMLYTQSSAKAHMGQNSVFPTSKNSDTLCMRHLIVYDQKFWGKINIYE